MPHDCATLFAPLQLGATIAANRVVMAPMTRMRAADPAGVPTALMVEYYRQRATAGLIITEGTFFSEESRGYAGSPGIHTSAHVAAWRDVVDGVHRAGGKIALQLLHTGRVSHRELLAGRRPLSASELPFDDWVTLRGVDGALDRVDCEMPRAMTLNDIDRTLYDVRNAVRNARDAGFDLIEVHAAHGYLLHQFLSAAGNVRDDAYGGSVQNRARFTLEAFDAAAQAWDSAHVGVRISPIGVFCDLADPDGPVMAPYLAAELSARGAAYLHVSEPDWIGGPSFPHPLRTTIRQAFAGPIIWAGGYTAEKARQMRQAGIADAVAFGRSFLANPDLPHRLARGLPLNEPVRDTFYGGAAKGYVDYPTA